MPSHPRFLTVLEAANLVYEDILRPSYDILRPGAKGLRFVRRNNIDTMLATELDLTIDRGSSSQATLNVSFPMDSIAAFAKIPIHPQEKTKSVGKYRIARLEMVISGSATTRTHTQAQVFSEVLAELAKVARNIESAIGTSTIVLRAPFEGDYLTTNERIGDEV